MRDYKVHIALMSTNNCRNAIIKPLKGTWLIFMNKNATGAAKRISSCLCNNSRLYLWCFSAPKNRKKCRSHLNGSFLLSILHNKIFLSISRGFIKGYKAHIQKPQRHRHHGKNQTLKISKCSLQPLTMETLPP